MVICRRNRKPIGEPKELVPAAPRQPAVDGAGPVFLPRRRPSARSLALVREAARSDRPSRIRAALDLVPVPVG